MQGLRRVDFLIKAIFMKMAMWTFFQKWNDHMVKALITCVMLQNLYKKSLMLCLEAKKRTCNLKIWQV